MSRFKRPNRSDRYQYFFNEYSVDNLEIYREYQDLINNTDEYNDEIAVLWDEYHARLFELMEERLTERQYEIVQLLRGGLNMSEVADELGLIPASIWKSMFGIKKTNNKGIQGKMCKIAEQDLILKSIKQKIIEKK